MDLVHGKTGLFDWVIYRLDPIGFQNIQGLGMEITSALEVHDLP